VGHPCPRCSSFTPFLPQQLHITVSLSLGRLFLRRPPLFLSSLPPQLAIPTISLPSLAAHTKSRRCSPATPAFCSQPLPLVAATTTLVSSFKKITVMAAAAAVALTEMAAAFSPLFQSRPHHGHPLLPPTPLPHDLPPRQSPSLTHLFRHRPAPFFLLNRSQSPYRCCHHPPPLPPLPFLPSAAAASTATLAEPRCPLLLFLAASTAAKPSSIATLISSSSSPLDSHYHLPSQPQPPPSVAPAPCSAVAATATSSSVVPSSATKVPSSLLPSLSQQSPQKCRCCLPSTVVGHLCSSPPLLTMPLPHP
ncbi:hypothetical protein BHM03_00057607, partial [Ensete ventricosum]